MAIIQLSGPTNSTTASGSTDLFPITLFGAVKSTTGSGAQTLQDVLDSKLDKKTGDGLKAYIHSGSTQSDLSISSTPAGGVIPCYSTQGRLQTNTPSTDNDCANKKYVDNRIIKDVLYISSSSGTWQIDPSEWNYDYLVMTTNKGQYNLYQNPENSSYYYGGTIAYVRSSPSNYCALTGEVYTSTPQPRAYYQQLSSLGSTLLNDTVIKITGVKL